MGAAYLAGMATGVFPGHDGELAGLAQFWQRDRRFEPSMSEDERATRYEGWHDAVRRVRSAVET